MFDKLKEKIADKLHLPTEHDLHFLHYDLKRVVSKLEIAYEKIDVASNRLLAGTKNSRGANTL